MRTAPHPDRTKPRAGMLWLGVWVIAVGCATGDADRIGQSGSTDGATASTPVASTRYAYPDPPVVRGEASADAAEVFNRLVGDLSWGGSTTSRLDEFVATGDARHAWLISDLLRFTAQSGELDQLVAAFVELTGVDPSAARRSNRVPGSR